MNVRLPVMLLALVPSAILLVGCTKVVPGEVVGTRPVPGTDRVLDEEVVLMLDGRPGVESPNLTLRAVRRAQVAYEVEAVHQAIRADRRAANFFGGLLGMGVGGAAVTIGLEQTEDDSLTDGGKWLVGGGVAIGVIGLLLTMSPFIDMDEPIEGRTVRGERSEQQGVRTRGPVAGIAINISGEGIPDDLVYTTDARGRIVVDVVEQFGWRWFTEPAQFRLHAREVNGAAATDVSLHASDWTVPCVVTEGSGVVLDNRTGGNPIGRFAGGEVYEVLQEDVVDWYGIRYRGRQGWIPRLVASRCWSTPDLTPPGSEPSVPQEGDSRQMSSGADLTIPMRFQVDHGARTETIRLEADATQPRTGSGHPSGRHGFH